MTDMIWFVSCNPFVTLIYFLAVTALSAVYNNPLHTALTLVSAVVMFILCGGRKKAAFGFCMIFLLTFIVNPIISKKGATPLVFIGSDPITLEAIIYGLNSASLIAAILFLFYCFTDMTNSEKLMYMLSPFSASFTLTVSAVLRFFPLYVRQAEQISEQVPGYWNMFADWKSIASGLGWGLGYFGMPHIIIRFMSVRSDKDLRKSAKIGISWNELIILFSVAAGCIGHLFLGDVSDSSTVFIQMVRSIFPALISGILLSAILAASMSTADSQLLCASSAFAADVYKPVIRKNKTSDKEMFWAGRIVVLIIAVIAVLIAANPNSGSIMGLVENAWGIFGAAFGPAILLSLFWKRFTFWGAVSGIAAGAAVDIAWLILGNSHPGSIFTLYEIIPGFIAGLIVAVAVTLIDKQPKQEVLDLYDLASSDQID